MAYIEIKERTGKKYYYLTESVREGRKIKKKRDYLGVNLSEEEIKKKKTEFVKEKKVKSNIEKIKPIILKILRKYHVKKAGIFGSYARGEQTKESDIDILIEPPEGMGFAFAGLEIELEETMKKKVDLVSYNGISPHLKDRILAQEIRIL
ncbi:MAG: nucleotidyltransferase family protein [Nanoarchaeota archaeon]